MLSENVAYLAGIIGVIVTAVVASKKKMSFGRTLAWLAFVSYASLVLALTLFPIPVDTLAIEASRGPGFGPTYNLVPFHDIVDAWRTGPSTFFTQVLGNVFMFTPLGFLLPILSKRARGWRPALSRVLLASLSIELIQLSVSLALGVSYKVADIDDLVLNFLGGLLGYVGSSVCLLLRKRVLSNRPSVAGTDLADEEDL